MQFSRVRHYEIYSLRTIKYVVDKEIVREVRSELIRVDNRVK